MSLQEIKSRWFSCFWGGLLGCWDRVYLLSLLLPLFVYNLVLKAHAAASRPGGLGLARAFRLMRSDVFFNLGYVQLWIGLFAAVRRGPLRLIVVFFFHLVTVLMALARAATYRYDRETGTTLDYDIVALWLPRFDEIKPMLKLPLPVRMLLALALCYAALGPLLISRLAERQGWISPTEMSQTGSFLGPLRLFLQASFFGFLSLLVGRSPSGVSRSFARDPVVNLVVTGVRGALTEKEASDAKHVVEHPAAGAGLVRTSCTEKRNVVLIHLESTRAQSATPYNQDLETMPFLDELSRSSLLVERAYTVVPNTLKASVAVNCGIEPLFRPAIEAKPGGIPVRGLADLLKEQGYSTVFFQSSTKNFENFGDLVRRLGYGEYYPLETMDTEGFEQSNYFGYEDDIMLGPSEEWLKEYKGKPFVAKYLTGTGHHEYLPPKRYGLKYFSEDDRLNRYLNCLRYQDFFLRNLLDQYKKLGLYEETIFVIYGDHGEGFGEHGRYVHEDNPYEESLKVPLLIHDPRRFHNGERVEGPSNLTDILPTVLDLLGYEVRNGEYPGYSLLRPLPEDRTLMFSSFNKDKYLASMKGTEKYIHHYGNQPDEFYDLSVDPFEEHNLVDKRAEEVRERREELLAWRSRNNAIYGSKISPPGRLPLQAHDRG